MIRSCLAAFAFALSATAATAASVDWEGGLSVSASLGPENPLVLFGFNPQPEPPAVTIEDDLDPTKAIRRVLGVEPTPFRFFFAMGDAQLTSGPMPVGVVGAPFLLGFDLGVQTDGGEELTLELRFLRNGSAAPIDIDALFFNPQPEPPASWAGRAIGADVTFVGLAAGDSVALSIGLRSDGELVQLTSGPAPALAPIPLPAPGLLLGAGVFGLAALRRRQRAG